MMRKLPGLILTLLLVLMSFSALCENDSTDSFAQLGTWMEDFGAQFQQLFSEGYQAVSQSVTDTMNIASEYLSQLSSEFDKKTQKAWTILTEAADQTVSHTKEEVERAWAEVQKWAEENGRQLDENLRSTIDAVGSAAGVAQAQVSIWLRTVEDTFAQNSEKVSAEVQKAWATVEQAVENAGSVTGEKLKEAYGTVRTWMLSLDHSAESARVALDDLMAQTQKIMAQ